MNQKTIMNVGFSINFATILIYFFLIPILDILPALSFLKYPGVILMVGGILLIVFSIITLRRPHETAVVSSGVYALIRHPMYFGAMCLFISMACFLPHWIIAVLVIINLQILHNFMVDGERMNVRKFGLEYKRYMRSVPRLNILAGFIRLLRK